jgi:hypothetical protein
MIEKFIASETTPALNKQVQFTPHGITLVAMWLLTTVALVLMLFDGVRDTGRFRVEREALQAVYVLALSWYLIRSGLAVEKLPNIGPLMLPNLRIGKRIPVIAIALLFVSEFFVAGILLPHIMLATIWILIVWRREISLPTVLLGLAVTVIAFWAGLPFYQNQAVGEVLFIVFLGFTVLMFIAGGLLSQRTGLVGSQLYAGQYRQAVLSFLWGCVLFIPLGLTNAAAGSPSMSMTWVNRWWIPFSQPLFSGIVEEAWWRLVVVSLCYFLLRPIFSKRPAVAMVCAVLFSAIPFGLFHGGTLLERVLITGLLYGLPMAVVFAKRDWEHAMGAHYMINMIPTLMVFLES